MSSLKVEVVKIDEILPHPNADRLEIAKIGGWNCVVRKDEYKAGDTVIYIPIDAVLPIELESKLFPPDSKIKLSKSRVKTIKLRGAISQGIVVTLEEVGLAGFPNDISYKIGADVAGTLGITKYEPPVNTPNLMRGNMVSPKKGNSNFRKYTDIENFKHYNELFKPGDLVWVSEKLHGTSARYAWLPTEANTFWKKVKKFFKALPRYEFCLGSRNVQLQDKSTWDGFYDSNVYGKIAAQEGLRDKIPQNTAVYGEVVGSGIQKGYEYGCKQGEHKFFAYDVMVDGKYLGYYDFQAFCSLYNIPTVPRLYLGKYDQPWIDKLRVGDSMIGDQKVREGVVIKSVEEETCIIGRKVVKWLSDDYLLGDQSEFH